MRHLRYTLTALGLSAATAPVHAVFVNYGVTALGGNQYRYEYSVTNDGSLRGGAAIGLFDVLFDPTLYLESSLTIVTPNPPASDWIQQILASAPGLPALYDVSAVGVGIVAGETMSGFAVEFQWLGGPAGPGGQGFQIYDLATFDLMDEGTTVSPVSVPVPAALWLLSSGLLGLLCLTGMRGGRTRSTDNL